jgi:hypothetical protein
MAQAHQSATEQEAYAIGADACLYFYSLVTMDTKAVRDKGVLLEPVDIKKDLYGFVYAPERNSGGLYDPFPNASAYYQ